jgi:hypothetical protein
MNTNTSAVSTTPNLTLREAVVNAVNELKTDGNFSAHDITMAIRAAANGGEIALPGLENRNAASQSGIKYWVNHEDVKRVIDALLNDGTLNNLGLTNVDSSGDFRVFEFGTQVAAPSAPVLTPSTRNASNPSASPVVQKLKLYLSAVRSATLKQVQSALKINGVTCKDLAGIASQAGFTVRAGTPNCYSTYTVS